VDTERTQENWIYGVMQRHSRDVRAERNLWKQALFGTRTLIIIKEIGVSLFKSA
jgi:hypothetical protein